MSIDTAIEEMIASALDDSDFVTGMTAEMYTDGEISDLRADMAKAAPAAEEQDENLLQELADSAPRAVNQIDWILGGRAGSTSIFAGYPTIDMLEQFVRSNLGTEEESKTMMIIMMTLATARNLINEKLEAES